MKLVAVETSYKKEKHQVTVVGREEIIKIKELVVIKKNLAYIVDYVNWATTIQMIAGISAKNAHGTCTTYEIIKIGSEMR